MRAKTLDEAIKHMPGRDIKPPPPKFNFNKIRKCMIDLKKNYGYIVYESDTISTFDNGRDVYWKIGKPDGTGFVGLGYSFPAVRMKTDKWGENPTYEDQTDYYFHNSHSGNINKPSTALNGVWNHSGKNPGPGGWYTFDEEYILKEIQNIKNRK